jgi:hypothetical protein
MAAKHYRSAQLVFGWSFYKQGSSGGTSSADEFLDAALTWFGDPDPCIGTAWEKGERLAKLVAHRRTLLILDGLEPLQNPPGPQEGRVREPSIQSLLRELAVSLSRPHLLFSALMGRWRYSLQTDKLTATMQIADHFYLLAQEQNDSALMIAAYNALASTLFFMGDFEAALPYAMRGVQVWRSESVQSQLQEVGASAVSVLCHPPVDLHSAELP